MSTDELSFVGQLVAYKRARLALSRAKRGSSPKAWWAGGVWKVVATLILLDISMAVAGGIQASILGEPGTPEGWGTAEALWVPAFFWGWLLLASIGHDPLSRGFVTAGAARWRSGSLLVADGLLSKSTLLLVTIGLLPWLTLHRMGWRFLTPVGWLGLGLLLVFMCSYWQLVRALRLNLTVLAGARSTWTYYGVQGLVGFASIAASQRALAAVTGGGREPASWLSEPETVLSLAILCAATTVLTVAIWAGRFPRLPDWQSPGKDALRRFVLRWQIDIDLYGESAVWAGFRMQVLRLARDPATWLGLGWLPLARALELFDVGFSHWEVLALITATSGFYNLYGDQALHYVVWLGSGRPLREFTHSLILARLVCAAVTLVLGVALLLAPRWSAPGRAAEFAFVLSSASVIAIVAGPGLSRAVPVASLTRATWVARTGLMGLSWGVALVVIAALTGVAELLRDAGLVWLGGPIFAGLAGLAWVARPREAAWSARLRGRFYRAFVIGARA